jgi:6-phosphogluconate dehydrogenase
MEIGIIGLGTMGNALAYRLIQAQHKVFGFDVQSSARDALQKIDGIPVQNIKELAGQTNLFWIMVPAGKLVDDVLQELQQYLKPGAIIIDGGNSKWTDSVRRAQQLSAKNIEFLDCGTSGGLQGRELGFSLMIGGKQEIYAKMQPIFKALAAPNSYAHVGPHGAGHYVKMIHNGIEYALLQSYAEGFQILKQGSYKDLDLEQISGVWQQAAIIRSYILDLAHEVFKKDQNFEDISGAVNQTGMGLWTVEEAQKNNIPATLIKDALAIRDQSQKTGGSYATKLVALLRHQFGGHAVTKNTSQKSESEKN